jgi:hypothetical protein
MIRRGRSEGWLKRPTSALPAWAEFNGVVFHGIKIGPMPGFEERGSTAIAIRDLTGSMEHPLLVVPRDLIISRQNVDLWAKADLQLKEVLEAAGDFGRVSGPFARAEPFQSRRRALQHNSGDHQTFSPAFTSLSVIGVDSKAVYPYCYTSRLPLFSLRPQVLTTHSVTSRSGASLSDNASYYCVPRFQGHWSLEPFDRVIFKTEDAPFLVLTTG